MNSMPLILARLTVSGLAIIDFLVLWLFVKQCYKRRSAAPDETARHFLARGG